jgi:hypothetical protein
MKIYSSELSESDAKRFWDKVDKSGDCWNWKGAADRKGYGKFSIGPSRNKDGSRRNSMVSAHRVAYLLANGPIPDGKGTHGTCVLHKCDNPKCVNPNHLFLGTNADNVHDMDAKGRRVNAGLKGESHGCSILTEQQVCEIFKRNSSGESTQKQLAKEYGVSIATVNHIMRGRLWAHLGLISREEQQCVFS